MQIEREILPFTKYDEPIIDLEYLLPAHLRPTVSELTPFQTQEEWLASANAPMGSDHSTDHPARVLIWQEFITRYHVLHGEEIPLDSRNALRWFAAIHDSQRFDDDYDLQHGERAAVFAQTRLGHLMTATTLAETMYLCRAHVPHDHHQPRLTRNARRGKDADLLDRGRGCNDLRREFIREPITHLLIHHARQLHDLSLQIDSGDHFRNVMLAAVHLGYVVNA